MPMLADQNHQSHTVQTYTHAACSVIVYFVTTKHNQQISCALCLVLVMCMAAAACGNGWVCSLNATCQVPVGWGNNCNGTGN